MKTESTKKWLDRRVKIRDLKRTRTLRLGVLYEGEYQHAIVKQTRSRVSKKIGSFEPGGAKPGYMFTHACPERRSWRARREVVRVAFRVKDCLGGGEFYKVDGAREVTRSRLRFDVESKTVPPGFSAVMM